MLLLATTTESVVGTDKGRKSARQANSVWGVFSWMTVTRIKCPIVSDRGHGGGPVTVGTLMICQLPELAGDLGDKSATQTSWLLVWLTEEKCIKISGSKITGIIT